MHVRFIASSELWHLLALYQQLHPTDDAADSETAEAVWNEAQSNPRIRYFGGYDGDRLVATCCLTVIPNLTRGCRPYALIENVVTHGDYRNQGWGKAVLAAATEFAWASGCYKVMLMTGRTRESVHRFYEAAGFDRNAKQAFIAKNAQLEGTSSSGA